MTILVKKVDFQDPGYVAVISIRRDVFIREQKVPEQLEMENEQSSTFFLAYYDGIPVGTARFRSIAGQKYKIERVATLPSYRGKGIGKAIMQFMLKHLLEQIEQADQVYLNSQESAVSFYLPLGFEIEGEAFFEAGIKHFKMLWKG